MYIVLLWLVLAPVRLQPRWRYSAEVHGTTRAQIRPISTCFGATHASCGPMGAQKRIAHRVARARGRRGAPGERLLPQRLHACVLTLRSCSSRAAGACREAARARRAAAAACSAAVALPRRSAVLGVAGAHAAAPERDARLRLRPGRGGERFHVLGARVLGLEAGRSVWRAPGVGQALGNHLADFWLM